MHLREYPHGQPYDDNTRYILKVSLKHGRTYAVDIAGTQYCYTEGVTPWPEHLKMISREIERKCYGSGSFWEPLTKDSTEESRQIFASPFNDDSAAVTRKHLKHFEYFDDAVNKWCNKNKITVAKMLRLESCQYDKMSACFVRYVTAQMRFWAMPDGLTHSSTLTVPVPRSKTGKCAQCQ